MMMANQYRSHIDSGSRHVVVRTTTTRIILPLCLTAWVVWLLEQAATAGWSRHDNYVIEDTIPAPPTTATTTLLLLSLLTLTCALFNVTSHAWVVAGRLQQDVYALSILVGVGFDVVCSALYLLHYYYSRHFHPLTIALRTTNEWLPLSLLWTTTHATILAAALLIGTQWILHVRALRLANHDLTRLRAVVQGAYNNLRGEPGHNFNDHCFAYTDLGYHLFQAQWALSCVAAQCLALFDKSHDETNEAISFLLPFKATLERIAMDREWIWTHFTLPLLMVIGMTAWWSFPAMHDSSGTNPTRPTPGLLTAVKIKRRKQGTTRQPTNGNGNNSIEKDDDDDDELLIPICHCPVCQGQQAFAVDMSCCWSCKGGPRLCHLWFQSFGQLCHILQNVPIRNLPPSTEIRSR